MRWLLHCQGSLRWIEENNNKTGDCYYLFELDHDAACTPPLTGLSTGSVICIMCVHCVTSVFYVHPCVVCYSTLWCHHNGHCCWLGGRKIIRPVKSDEVLACLSVWSEVQMTCIWLSYCDCHSVISASENLEWFILLVPAYPGCPGKGC